MNAIRKPFHELTSKHTTSTSLYLYLQRPLKARRQSIYYEFRGLKEHLSVLESNQYLWSFWGKENLKRISVVNSHRDLGFCSNKPSHLYYSVLPHLRFLNVSQMRSQKCNHSDRKLSESSQVFPARLEKGPK